ncbi:MAG TPA: hypothetical protein VFO54_03015 [Chryseosolibacter sp.]|nr:hypothetical protein [Chryseosolibacter sp.]
MKLHNYMLVFFLLLTHSIHSGAQSPKLFFREDWKEIEAALPVTQEHVANADLVLSLHGPASGAIKKSNHPNIPNDPYYIWSGECKGNWAVSLRHRSQSMDLTGEAQINIRSKQSGFRLLRIILKLADGNWLVSDQYAGFTDDWTEKRFSVAEIHWRKLTMDTVTEGAWVPNPDLSKVVEVGFTDLMAGGGTPASSRLDWIEVYGKPVSATVK